MLGAMKIATLVGTSRPGNLTQHALALVEDELKKGGAEVTRFDPAGKRLPFPGEEGEFPDAKLLESTVRESMGVVIATPEYHGSFPAMLKLILENMGFPSALSGKPIALLGVAAGRIGAIKSLEQLRSVCSHTGAIVLPAPISVPGMCAPALLLRR
jgi:NAD(P)H-dependent FMN reductase